MCHTTYVAPSDCLDNNIITEGILYVRQQEALGIKRLNFNVTERTLSTPYQHFHFKPILLPDGSIQCKAPVKNQDYETSVAVMYHNEDKDLHSDNHTVIQNVQAGIHLYYPIVRYFDMEKWVNSSTSSSRDEMKIGIGEYLGVEDIIYGANDADPDRVVCFEIQSLVLAGDPDDILAASQDAFSVASFRFPTPENLKEILADMHTLPNFSDEDPENDCKVNFGGYLENYIRFYNALKPLAEQNAKAQDENEVLANEGLIEIDTETKA